MFIVLLNWLFIFFVLLGFGWWGRAALRKIFRLPFDRLHPTLHLLLGLTVLVTACNIASFFIRINIEVNIAFSVLAFGGIYLFKREILEELRKWWHTIGASHFSTKIAFGLFFVIALLRTISPSEISDEGGYHLPLIRWIENYPVVPGIANIEDRMGFNPSKYIADAFFSVPYMFKEGLYELNSFLFLLFNGFFLCGYDRLYRGRFEGFFSDLIASAAMVFLWRAYLTSVDADYLNIFLGLTMLILLVRKIESGNLLRLNEPSILITLFFSFIITVKFSSVLIGLPLMLLWLPLLFQRKINDFLVRLVMVSLFVLMPWICRNYLISGYPIYPLYFFVIGEPDWQVLPDIAKGQFEYIREYAKNEMECSVNDYRVENLPIREWFPHWFQINWKMLIGKVLFIGLSLGLVFWSFFIFNLRRIGDNKHMLLLAFLLMIAIGLWFFRFPSIRLFWSGQVVFIFLMIGLAVRYWMVKNIFVTQLLLAVFLFSGLIRSTISSVLLLPNFHLLLTPACVQAIGDCNEIQLGGHLVKLANDNQCYGAMPPCFPEDYLKKINFRGSTIEAGFKVLK